MPTITVEPAVDLELAPTVKAEVTARLDEYFGLQAVIKQLEQEADRVKADMRDYFEREGIGVALDAGVKVEGKGSAKMVYPTKSTLDKKKLVSLGVTMAQIERATVTSPSTPYLKLTPPGREAK